MQWALALFVNQKEADTLYPPLYELTKTAHLLDEQGPEREQQIQITGRDYQTLLRIATQIGAALICPEDPCLSARATADTGRLCIWCGLGPNDHPWIKINAAGDVVHDGECMSKHIDHMAKNL